MKSIRTVSLVACGAAILLGSPAAESAGSKNACASGAAYRTATEAYKSALTAVQDGHLREARKSLETCTEVACGGIALKCKAANTKLASMMPTIIPIVTDETGTLRADVAVKIDGDLLTSRLDGRGLAVDTGLHELSFSLDGNVFETAKIMILESDRDRILNVTRRGPGGRKADLAATAQRTDPPSDPPAAGNSAARSASSGDRRSDDVRPEDSEGAAARTASGGGKWALPRSPWPYVLGGAGVAAVAAGGLLTYWGNKDNTELENRCAPDCTAFGPEHVKTMYIASDAAFGVGLAALGVATWLFASSHSAEKTPPVVSVAPVPSGGVASVSGRF